MNAEAVQALASSERVIRPRQGFVAVNFAELWRYRELFGFLAWRDILVRYKQTYLGVAWALLQPFLTMVVFTVVFGKLAKFPSNGAPYAVLTLAGLLPWQFFANALSESSGSVVASSRMISKIYFPRLIIPASAVLSGVVDFLIGFLILVAMMIWYGAPVHLLLLALPLFFCLALMAAFAAGTWLSALNVKYRDVKYVVPFFTRMGLLVSPVGFLSGIIPERWRFWYGLNPMVGVIDGFRWCILGPGFEPYLPNVITSIAVTLVLFIGGVFYFRSTERTFADII